MNYRHVTTDPVDATEKTDYGLYSDSVEEDTSSYTDQMDVSEHDVPSLNYTVKEQVLDHAISNDKR